MASVGEVKIELNGGKAKGEMKQKKKLALRAIGEKAVTLWKKIITDKGIIDTGRFRNSTSFKPGKDDVTIYTNVKYAPFLELGTRKQRARPSLKPAIIDNKNVYRKIIEDIMKR